MNETSLRDRTLKEIHAIGERHNCDTRAHEEEVAEILDGMGMKKVFALAAQRQQNPADASVTTAGTNRFRIAVATVLGVLNTMIAVETELGQTVPTWMTSAQQGLTTIMQQS